MWCTLVPPRSACVRMCAAAAAAAVCLLPFLHCPGQGLEVAWPRPSRYRAGAHQLPCLRPCKQAACALAGARRVSASGWHWRRTSPLAAAPAPALLCVRVVRMVLLFCLCVAKSHGSQKQPRSHCLLVSESIRVSARGRACSRVLELLISTLLCNCTWLLPHQTVGKGLRVLGAAAPSTAARLAPSAL